MRLHYYTLADMYRLKGGFLKKTNDSKALWERQKAIFDVYTKTYPFLLNLKYYRYFRDTEDVRLHSKIKSEIERYYRNQETVFKSRVELIKNRLSPDGLLETNRYEKQIEEIEKNLTRIYSSIEDKQNSLNSLFNDVQTKEAEIIKLQDLELELQSNREEKLNQLLESMAEFGRTGFFRLIASGCGQSLWVTSDIEMKDTTGTVVYFGKFLVLMSEKNLLLWKFQNNLTSRYYYHTYVSSNGSICWGNKSADVRAMIEQNSWGQVADVLETLLTAYQPSGPYATFKTFLRQENKNARNSLYPDDYQGYCKFISEINYFCTSDKRSTFDSDSSKPFIDHDFLYELFPVGIEEFNARSKDKGDENENDE